ncbi:MAG: hypothetical protein JXA39_02120 [Bacteroidales bacterium]|nr:hypothetical protein [Bacteroidales bacterium]
MEKRTIITPEKFMKFLTFEQMGAIVKHFKRIYNCRGFYDKEQKLAYLAWLTGEGHLMVTGNFLIYDLAEVAFEYGDYTALINEDLQGSSGFGRVRKFYDLDTLYIKVLKNGSPQ